jgi:mannose-6-phosphate isomerase
VACTVFEPVDGEQLRMRPLSESGRYHYPVPVEDFCFDVFSNVSDIAMQTASAEIILVIDGGVIAASFRRNGDASYGAVSLYSGSDR